MAPVVVPPTALATTSTMDSAYRGNPFVAGPVNSSDDLATMDFAYRGRPFIVVVT